MPPPSHRRSRSQARAGPRCPPQRSVPPHATPVPAPQIRAHEHAYLLAAPIRFHAPPTLEEPRVDDLGVGGLGVPLQFRPPPERPRVPPMTVQRQLGLLHP